MTNKKNTVLYEQKNKIGYITINRPKALNALNVDARNRLWEILKETKENTDVRVIFITGYGNKAFSAGADLDELMKVLKTANSARDGAISGQLLFNFIEQLGKFTIAAVNGYALGGGCELILACTIRVASTEAKFGLPEINLGILPGHGGIPRLARLVGKDRAAEMILTGDMIDADEAYRIGLVTHLASHDELMETCEKIAHRIIEKGEIAVRLGLEAINHTSEMTLEKGLAIEAALTSLASSTQDSQERIKALIEKRR